MPLSKYRGYSLRNRIFGGFIIICLLSIAGSTVLSYFVLKSNAQEQNLSDKQRKSDALMASLDYAVSHEQLRSEDLPKVLGNKIFEIADISKADVIIYDLKGKYLVSNKESEKLKSERIPVTLLNNILSQEKRIDIETYDPTLDANLVSSYMVLKNNTLEPIGIVYFPFYHSDSAYLSVLNRYVGYVVAINFFIVLIALWLSWVISRNLSNTLTKFSNWISRLTLFDKEIKSIPYYGNDEFRSLVTSYNRMIVKIQEQKEQLSFTEKEQAWREMAKQVAHEVKNPLTPMKLTIQNFSRKFDPTDPDIEAKVAKMSDSVVEQIDLVATVATAFSQFAQLPEKNDEVFNLNDEVAGIVRIFNDENVFIHANRNDIMIKMDKIYLNRIITNLITNANQATLEEKKPIINLDLEQIQKRIKISVEDNGVGIEENMFDRIFEPNFTSKNSGMGLGLTMVRKMVEEYKGEIHVQSEVGKGSKFIVTLPTNM